MRKRSALIPVTAVISLTVIAIAVYLNMARFDTTLDFQFRDAVSKNWVWDSTIKLQNRLIRGFYQSDAGPVVNHFSHLKTGDAELEISAPAYETAVIPVTLNRGRNVVEEPIELVGYEIPNLQRFIIFESLQGEDIILEIRPVGTDGRAVLNHPCLDLWIGCRVSAQMKEGLYVTVPTEEGSTRGEELFKGKIEWEWDPLPETTFRFSARIPGSRIKEHQAPIRIIDYLIIVPDPRKIDQEELEKLMKNTWDLTEPEALTGYLDSYKGRLSYYISASWNVERGGL